MGPRLLYLQKIVNFLIQISIKNTLFTFKNVSINDILIHKIDIDILSENNRYR